MTITINGTDGITTPEVTLDNTSADGGQVVLKSSGYSNWNLDNYSGRIRAYYGSTEYFTINTSGNVGVGTNPSYKLESATTSSTQLALQYTGVGRYLMGCDSGFNFVVSKETVGDRLVIDTNGNMKFNSGYGSVATAYGCRAWCYYNSSQAIVASANVSSITVLGTGDSQINFTNAMPDANFCAVASTNEDGGTPKYCNPTNPTTAKIRVVTFNSAGTKVNNTYNYVAVFR